MNTTTLTPTSSTKPAKSQAQFDAEFTALLATWNSHQQLKDQHAPMHELWESNGRLASQRYRAATSAPR